MCHFLFNLSKYNSDLYFKHSIHYIFIQVLILLRYVQISVQISVLLFFVKGIILCGCLQFWFVNTGKKEHHVILGPNQTSHISPLSFPLHLGPSLLIEFIICSNMVVSMKNSFASINSLLTTNGSSMLYKTEVVY